MGEPVRKLEFPRFDGHFLILRGECHHAENYPADFRDQIVATGRSIEDLAREFEPCAATIHGWVKQADRDGGRRTDGLTSEERDELRRLRRENRQLRQERDILAKAAAWFAQSDAMPANQAMFPTKTMSRILGVSRSGYYAWRERAQP